MDDQPGEHGQFSIGGVRLERRSFIKGLAALAVLSPLAACSGTGASTAGLAATDSATNGSATANRAIPGPPWQGGVTGGNGVSIWQDDKLNFDPALAYGWGDYYGLSNFYRGLAFYDDKNQPVLDMAKSLDVSTDGLTYTFTLKPDLKFHNGRTVTADDFKWTFERSSSKKIGSWVQGFLASVEGHAAFAAEKAPHIAGITAPNPTTLVLRLTKPDVTILGVVGIPPFYVLPKEEVDKLGTKFSSNPVGCGPYRLKSWDENNRTVIGERFDGYEYAPDLPYLDTVEYQWGVTEDVAYLKVARNEADLTLGVPASAIPKIKQDPAQQARFKQWQSFTIEWWEFDVTKAPFNDVRVRQAVNYAFNRDRVKLLGYDTTGHFYPQGLLGFDAAAPVYTYDPEKARALLAAAGVPSLALTIPVMASTVPNNGRIAQLLQEDLQAVGMKVQLTQVQQSAFDLGATLPTKYPMWNMEWGMGLPDPAELVNSLIGTGAPSNYGGYSNASIDALGAKAISESDSTKRGAMYADIEKTLLQDAAFLFLGVFLRPSFTSEQLKNFTWNPVLWTYWDRYWKQV
jgi:ABC-type transport system substrate-binding protein